MFACSNRVLGFHSCLQQTLTSHQPNFWQQKLPHVPPYRAFDNGTHALFGAMFLQRSNDTCLNDDVWTLVFIAFN
jgi:hypothetical protein